jgi:hypothetical protein
MHVSASRARFIPFWWHLHDAKMMSLSSVYSDGEKEQDKGQLGIYAALTFKRFQQLMTQKTGERPPVKSVWSCLQGHRTSESKFPLATTHAGRHVAIWRFIGPFLIQSGSGRILPPFLVAALCNVIQSVPCVSYALPFIDLLSLRVCLSFHCHVCASYSLPIGILFGEPEGLPLYCCCYCFHLV